MQPTTHPPAGRREWLGFAVLALPTLLVSMDMTILYLATPSLSAALQPSGAELLWISDIYGFLIAGALIPMGAIGDRIGDAACFSSARSSSDLPRSWQRFRPVPPC